MALSAIIIPVSVNNDGMHGLYIIYLYIISYLLDKNELMRDMCDIAGKKKMHDHNMNKQNSFRIWIHLHVLLQCKVFILAGQKVQIPKKGKKREQNKKGIENLKGESTQKRKFTPKWNR